MKKLKPGLIILGVLLVGIIVGGYLFSKTQPRSILSVQHCDHCLSLNELTGLVGSVVVNQAPLLLKPVVVYETDKTVAIKNPYPESAVDYVIIPKKDIKDIGDLSDEDQPYLRDAYAVATQLINAKHLRDYSMKTYGPGYRQVRYLHFHLESSK